MVGDAIAGQRVIAQRTFERVRRLELEAGIEPSHYEPAPADGRRRLPRTDAAGRIGRAPITTQRGRRLTGAATSPPIAGGNVYDKYGSRNPVERRLVRGFCDELRALAIGPAPRDVHEVGCGEGELLLRLARRGLRARGSDVSEAVIDEARRRAPRRRLEVPFRAAPIEALDPSEDCRRADPLLRGDGAPG